jgi:hypothetical protein
MRQSTRNAIAAALIVLFAGSTASSARADEWCAMPAAVTKILSTTSEHVSGRG